MAIFITGDTHGDFSRLLPAAFHEQRDLTKEDYLIICGDFGGVCIIVKILRRNLTPFCGYRETMKTMICSATIQSANGTAAWYRPYTPASCI